MFEVDSDILNQILAKYSQQLFLIHENASQTFADFFSESIFLSKDINFQENQRYVLDDEDPEFLLKMMLAIWLKGGVAVPINPKFPEKQKLALMQKVDSEKSYSFGNQLQKYSQSKNFTSPQKHDFSINPKNAATVIFTSGSSGNPKAVLHNLSNHLFSALGANQIMPLNPGDKWLLSLPLFHVGGLAVFFRTLLAGAAFVIPPKNHDLVSTIQNHQITHLSLVPTQLYRLLGNPVGREILPNLKLILLGGAAIPASLMKQSSELGLNVQRTYGCTEMASQIATGKNILPFREVRLSADHEIEVRGKTRFMGYLNRHELIQPFDADGWYKTGDLGIWKDKVLDVIDQKANHSSGNPKHQYLSVIGRKDNMFISGGENIHPEEIEHAIYEYELVEQVIVVAINDAEYGTRPVAFLKSEVEISEDQLKNHLKKSLVRFKIPDLFLPWPASFANNLKPNRREFSKIAQTKFDQSKREITSSFTVEFEFRNWLAGFELGWMKVALQQEKQIFKLLDFRNNNKPRSLFISANSRQEVMNWLLAAENEIIFDAEDNAKILLNWRTELKKKCGSNREDFEIIRLLENELPLQIFELLDAKDRGNLNSVTINPQKNKNQEEISSQHIKLKENDPDSFFSEIYQKSWNWDFSEAVFQSGIYLKDFQRMYLLRCLYQKNNLKMDFLGWKVHLIRDCGSQEDLIHPFWIIDKEEENQLEGFLKKWKLFPENPSDLVNTPKRERERRKQFQTLIASKKCFSEKNKVTIQSV